MDFSQGPALGAVLPHGHSDATQLSFHEDGVHLFAASSNSLCVVNSQTGKLSDAQAHPLKAERDGIHLLSATHHDCCVLTTGTNAQSSSSVNYWSVYDNKILR